MSTQTEIANLTLTELGANEVSSIGDGSNEGNKLTAVWAFILDEVLKACLWDFAKKWTSVAEAVYVFIDDTYDYAYQLPSDFVKMSKLEYHNDGYVIRGDYILINRAGPLKFEYIWREEDESNYPTHFIRALVSRLKASVATPLSRDTDRDNEYYLKIYEDIDLPKAMAKDGHDAPNMSDTDLGLHTEANDPFLSKR